MPGVSLRVCRKKSNVPDDPHAFFLGATRSCFMVMPTDTVPLCKGMNQAQPLPSRSSISVLLAMLDFQSVIYGAVP